MQKFETRFNYLILFGRIVFIIFFSLISILLVYITIVDLKKNGYSIEIFFGNIFNLITIYFVYHFIDVISQHSHKLILNNGIISKISILTRKKRIYEIGQIIGFSTSEYPIKIWTFKTIILYLKNGEKIEFPQFQYLNFNEIEDELINCSIKKLGYEKYRWKFFDSRHYEFDK